MANVPSRAILARRMQAGPNAYVSNDIFRKSSIAQYPIVQVFQIFMCVYYFIQIFFK